MSIEKILNALSYGGITAVIGMLVVFTGLVILIVCIWGLGKLIQAAVNKAEKKKAAKAEASAAAVIPAAPAPVVEEAPVEENPVVNDAELIAVIAAAIAAYDDSGKRLVVRKVRRVSGWKDAARSEQVYHF